MPIEIPIRFVNKFQEDVYKSTLRNICASGGYGNGKTHICNAKIISLSARFPKYRSAILRSSAKDLRETTMVSFFKICPPELYSEALGGRRVDSHGYLKLINGSEIIWLHLKDYDESVVRGLEINSAFIDQAEEVDENIYDHLDSRVGRWDLAEIPSDMNPDLFPKNEFTGRPMPPSYMLLGCNPDSFFHWIYRKYHPDSPEHHEERIDPITKTKYRYSDTHIMFQGKSTDNPALNRENLRTLLSRGKSFVSRFVLGQWGISGGTLHEVSPLSILQNPPKEFLRECLTNGKIYRTMDHGVSSPTCVLWWVNYKNWHICFQEYYEADSRISFHRKNIAELSVFDDGKQVMVLHYDGNYADPSIAKKEPVRFGGQWTVQDEYRNLESNAPPITWTLADNNEFVTRHRLDELLFTDQSIPHPITGNMGAPRIYFVKKSPEYPYGCSEVLDQLRNQKKKQVGTMNGEPVFSDERDPVVVDHAYDCVRYYISMRVRYVEKKTNKNQPGTFFYERQKMINRRPKVPHMYNPRVESSFRIV